MFKLNNEETFFIHIPRTGGASVYHAISEAKLCKSFGNVHSTINYLKGQGYEGKTYLIQVRNPFDRLYSTFCYLNTGQTFKDFCNLLNFPQENLHFRKQIRWLEGADESKTKLFKMEEETIWDYFKEKYPDKNIKSPHIHRDNSEDIHNNEEIYTPELKEFVYNYYKDDFEKLGYEYISQA